MNKKLGNLKICGLRNVFAVCLIFLSSLPVLSQMTNQSAYLLNGVNSYYGVPDNADLNPGAAATFEFWIKPAGFPAAGCVILGKNYGTGWVIALDPTGNVALQKGGGGTTQSSSALVLNSWTHVAVTYNNGSVAFYFNGSPAGTGSVTAGALPSNTDSMFVGCDREAGVPAYFMNGELDNIRIWSVVRNQAQLNAFKFSPVQFFPDTGQYNGLKFSSSADFTTTDWTGIFSGMFARGGAVLKNYNQQPVFYNDYNQNLYFDGTSYLAIQNHADFNLTTAITVEFWMKRDTLGAHNPLENLVNKSGGTNRYNWAVYLFNNGTQVTFQLNSGAGLISTPMNTTPTKQWYHIACTWSQASGIMKMYINGDSVSSGAFAGPIANDPDSICIGGMGNLAGFANKFKGQIDNFKVWSIARTSAEIKRDMYINNSPGNGAGPFNNIEYGFDALTYMPRISASNSFLTLPMFIRGSGVSVVSSHTGDNNFLTSPILRDDAGGFSSSNYFISTKRAFIPDPGQYSDSILVPAGAGGLLSGLRVFVLLNHTFVSDITLTLRGPQGQQVVIYSQSAGNMFNDIMTVFDSQADSSLSNFSGQPPYSPRIKPANSMNIFNNTQAAGYWKLTINDAATQDQGYLNGWGVQPAIITGNGNNTEVPNRFYLAQNYPNPFNPVTTISYGIAKNEIVKITIYDILGREVRVLINEMKKAGLYEISFDGTALSSGVYFYKINAGDFVETKKMLMIK